MSHPFFQAPKFPFHRPEGQELLRVVRLLYRSRKDIQAVFEDVGGDWANIVEDQAPNDLWRDALDNLCWTSLMERFCSYLLDIQPPIRPEFTQAVSAVINASQNRVSKYTVSERLFLLDRESIRTQVEQLADEGAPEKVFLIRGGKSSGKSHCHLLIQRKAAEVGASYLYMNASKTADARQVIEQLYGHFNRSTEVPAVETTTDAWYKRVCIRLKEIADTVEPPSKRKPLWIVMDDLGVDHEQNPILPSDVRQFFNQFALNMDNTSFQELFRVILIGYPIDTPTEWAGSFWMENESPLDEKDIQVEDVKNFLLDWASSQGKIINPDDLATRSQKILETIDTLPAPDQESPPRLRRIHSELGRIIKDLKSQTA